MKNTAFRAWRGYHHALSQLKILRPKCFGIKGGHEDFSPPALSSCFQPNESLDCIARKAHKDLVFASKDSKGRGRERTQNESLCLLS